MWFKNFRNRKLQTGLLFLIVLFCTLILSVSVNILTSMEEPFHRLAEDCQSATAVVYPYDDRDEAVNELTKRLESLDEVDKAITYRRHYISENMNANGKKIEAFTSLTEYDNEVFGNIRYTAGSKEDVLQMNDNECAIPTCISTEFGIKIGDSITVDFDEQQIAYTVKAIFTEPYSTSVVYNSYILVNQLPDTISSDLQIQIYGKDGVSTKDIEEAYRAKYNGNMDCEFNGLDNAISNALISNSILGAILLVIGIIMLLVSGLIVNFMIRNTMLADAKKIAIYKTMGYSVHDITKMYLLFYFVLASTACILALVVSAIFSQHMLQNMYTNIGEDGMGNMWMTSLWCFTGIVSFIIGLITLIIRKSRKVRPVYALNGMTATNTRKHKHYKGNYHISFSSVGIALRMLLRDKKGAIGILITAIVAIIGINFAIISIDVANGMKDNNDYWLGIDPCNVIVSLSEGVNYDTVNDLIKYDSRIDKIVSWSYNNRITLDWKKGMQYTNMGAFVYDSFDDVKLDITKGRNPENGDEIALSGLMAEELQKEIGDYVDIYINGAKKSCLVTGLYQTYYDMGKACRLQTAAFADDDRDFAYKAISIYLKDEADTTAFINETKDIIGGKGKVVPRTEQFESIMNLIMKPQQAAVPSVGVMVLIIGGINIFCIVLLKNANNIRNNGIYKSIGYSTTHLIKANIYYVMFIAILSALIAIPIVLCAYPLIMKMSLSMFGLLEYKISYNVLHLLVGNMAILVIFLLSTLLSSESLRKVHVRDLVQE